ncbi:MAG: site-specific integrase [Polaribacter sp.]|uniref:tyrosine-type recombinase/integrase n=1 Tax=Polaribacter sp. TaxID=1920175 RepID=UPI003BAF99F8
MASSIKITLRKKANKEGLYPLVIRITKDRKTNFLYTGYYLDKKHWDEKNYKVKKSYSNSTSLNNLLLNKLSEASKLVIDLESNKQDFSSREIKRSIVNPLGEETFNSVSQRFLKDLLENKKLSRLNSDKPRINHVIDFAKSEKLYFNEINEDFLKRFMSYLRTKRKNSERSIVNNLIVIRTLYNIAIKEGIIERKLYPFGKDKVKIKFPESEKIGLTKEEVQKIEELENLSQQENHARDIWLFSFYCAGMRVGDVIKIKWADIYDNRLHYKMNKNSKRLSIPLHKKSNTILEKYKDEKSNSTDFVFPELKLANQKSPKDILSKTKTATKKFNKYLKSIAKKAEIDKKVTMHIARHTFGNISGDKIPIQVLQKLYRHSHISTTMNYQSNFMHKEEDEALDKVINF